MGDLQEPRPAGTDPTMHLGGRVLRRNGLTGGGSLGTREKKTTFWGPSGVCLCGRRENSSLPRDAERRQLFLLWKTLVERQKERDERGARFAFLLSLIHVGVQLRVTAVCLETAAAHSFFYFSDGWRRCADTRSPATADASLSITKSHWHKARHLRASFPPPQLSQ